MSVNFTRSSNKFQTETDNLKNDIHFINALYQVGFMLYSCRLDIVSFRNSLEWSATHKLTSSFLNSQKLINILTKIKGNITSTLGMIAPIDPNHINLYYDAIYTTAFGTENVIYLMLNVPLLSTNGIYDKLAITTFPQYSDLNIYTEWELPSYIYINIKNDKYFTVENNLKCTSAGTLNICDFTGIIWKWTESNCILNLMIHGKSDFCPKKVIQDPPILLKRQNEDIIFYSKTAIAVLAICYDVTTKRARTESFTLKGQGIIYSMNDCELQTTNFILPRISIYQSNLNIMSQTHSTLLAGPGPNVDYSKIANGINMDTIRNTLNMMAIPNTHIPIKQILTHVKHIQTESNKHTNTKIISITSSTSASIIIMSILAFIAYKFCMKKRSNNIPDSNTSNVTQNITVEIPTLAEPPRTTPLENDNLV